VLLRPTQFHPRLEALQHLDFTNQATRPWNRLIQELEQAITGNTSNAVRVPRGAPPVVRQALAALNGPDSSKRKDAMETLKQINDPLRQAVLITLLEHPTRDVRVDAVGALGQLGDSAAVPALVARLNDQHWQVREACAGALARIKDTRAVPELLKALDDVQSEVRAKAAHALGELRDPSTVPALLEAFSDPHWNVRSMSALSLGNIGDASAVPKLIEALAIEGQEVRAAIARALGQLGDNRAGSALVEALCKEQYSEASYALENALKRIGRGAVPDLLKAIRSCMNWNAVWTMVRLIGDTRDPSAVKGLLDALRIEHSQAYRDVIINALEKIAENPDALPTLLDALHDEASLIRVVAVWVLGRLRVIEAVPSLIHLLADEEPVPPSADGTGTNRRVCDVAADTLTQIATPEALAAVEQWQHKQGKPLP
jgi:HEAT repeat protein